MQLIEGIPENMSDVFSECISLKSLGDEEGYRRLNNEELIQEGDETLGAFGTPWTPASKYQIGKSANSCGGFFIWRRKL